MCCHNIYAFMSLFVIFIYTKCIQGLSTTDLVDSYSPNLQQLGTTQNNNKGHRIICSPNWHCLQETLPADTAVATCRKLAMVGLICEPYHI